MNQPFSWGQSDCSFVFDVIREMTGFDAIAQMRGYTNEAGAMKAVRKAGFSSVGAIVEANFQEIDPRLALRGDIGYPASVPHPLMSPAIISGPYAFSKEPLGNVVVPRTLLARAWRV